MSQLGSNLAFMLAAKILAEPDRLPSNDAIEIARAILVEMGYVVRPALRSTSFTRKDGTLPDILAK